MWGGGGGGAWVFVISLFLFYFEDLKGNLVPIIKKLLTSYIYFGPMSEFLIETQEEHNSIFREGRSCYGKSGSK